MSFILDALRKSEHERQRGAVPGISQVPLAGRRHGPPRWTLAIIGMLTVAVIALGAAWWHTLRRVPAVERGTAPPAVATTPVPLKLPPVQTERATAAAERRASALPVATPAQPAAQESAAAARAAARRDTAPLARSGPDAAQPAEAQRDSAPTLPSAAALAAEGIGVPELRLELHAYSDKPAERFVFINGRKYGEGDTLVEGPRIVSIETNGAVLSQQGHRFLLATQ